MWCIQPIYDNCNPESIGETLIEAKRNLQGLISERAKKTESYVYDIGDEDIRPAVDDCNRKVWDIIGRVKSDSELEDVWREYCFDEYNRKIFKM